MFAADGADGDAEDVFVGFRGWVFATLTGAGDVGVGFKAIADADGGRSGLPERTSPSQVEPTLGWRSSGHRRLPPSRLCLSTRMQTPGLQRPPKGLAREGLWGMHDPIGEAVHVATAQSGGLEADADSAAR